MANDVLVLADIDQAHAAAAEAYLAWEKLLRDLVPDAMSIEHVGATSVAGCAAKGDLDIAVRVAAASFHDADVALASLFDRNVGSASSPEYSSFADESATPPLGVQLVVVGGAFDFFHTFRDALSEQHALIAEYNRLKENSAGAPMMSYRAAKAEFVAGVLEAAQHRWKIEHRRPG